MIILNILKLKLINSAIVMNKKRITKITRTNKYSFYTILTYFKKERI